MAIKDLLAVVKPPSHPVENGPSARWEAIERGLGVRLPSDFRDFGLHYGTGHLVNLGITIFNPFARDFPCSLSLCLTQLRAIRHANRDEFTKVIFPEPGGLFSWGTDEGGVKMCWLTEGEPNVWPVVIADRYDDRFETRFDMSVTSFMAKVLKSEISVPEAWSEQVMGVPGRTEFASVEPFPPRGLHQCPNSWVKHGDDLLGRDRYFHVKHIAGQERSWPIEDINPEVMVDVYENGLLVEENKKLKSAEAGRNFFSCPPEWAGLPNEYWPTRERKALKP